MLKFDISEEKSNYLKFIWSWLTEHFPSSRNNLAFYCGGRFTRELLHVNRDTSDKLSINVIFDDNYQEIDHIEGIKCDSIKNIDHYNVNTLFLATDTQESQLKEYFKSNTDIKINIISISYIQSFNNLNLNRMNFLSSVWDWMADNFGESKNVAFYCGGKFTRDILTLNLLSTKKLKVPVIFDDNYQSIKSIETIKCDSINSLQKYPIDVIFIATDSCEEEAKQHCQNQIKESEAVILGISDINKYFLKSPNMLLNRDLKYLPDNKRKWASYKDINTSHNLCLHIFLRDISALEHLKLIQSKSFKDIVISINNDDIKSEDIDSFLTSFHYNNVKINRTLASNSVESLLDLPLDYLLSIDFICNLGFDFNDVPFIEKLNDHSINCLIPSDNSIDFIINEFMNEDYKVCYPSPHSEEINFINDTINLNELFSSYKDLLLNSGITFDYKMLDIPYLTNSFFWAKPSELIEVLKLIKKYYRLKSSNSNFETLQLSLFVKKYLDPGNDKSFLISNCFESKGKFEPKDFADSPRAIAFYSLLENDRSQQKESVNCRELFPNHKNIRFINDKIDYYNKKVLDRLGEQIKLAKFFGIKGFCYKITENEQVNIIKSLIEVSEKNSFHFCFEVKISTSFFSAGLIELIWKSYESPLYLKDNSRPVLLINLNKNETNENLISSLKSSKSHSYLPLLSVSNSIPDEYILNKFDAIVENPFKYSEFLKVLDRKKELNTSFFHKGLVCDYTEFSKSQILKKIEVEKKTFRSLGPHWDPSIAQKDDCNILNNANPEAYESWFSHLIIKNDPIYSDCKTIFIYSWNEWKNGSALEPDNYFGFAMLNSTARALATPSPWKKLSFRKYKNPKISIIIPCYNNWPYTYHCLESILYNCLDVEYEIIIGDDNSTDETAICDKYIENIRVIRSDTNQGFIGNCNLSANTAKGEYIFFLNNDTFVHKGAIEELSLLLDSDKSIGMTGSKLVFADNKLQEAGGIIWQDASGWNYGRGDSPDLPEYNYLKDVDYISGAAIMIRKNLWHKAGGFDTRYKPAYYEDSDLAFMVRELGYRVVYNPKSIITHFEGISSGVDPNSGVKKYQTINKKKFFEKHKKTLEKHCPNGLNVFQSRDRSTNRKVILVIDHYVPEFDKDAGSRTMYTCLVRMVNLGFSVKFIGDNFLRPQPYTDYLEQIGVEVLYGERYAHCNWQKWLQENGAYIDFVFMNRPHISIKYIDFIKKWTKALVIYNVVDLHHIRLREEYKVSNNEETLALSKEFKEIENKLISKSDIVFSVSNDEVNYINESWAGKKGRWLPVFSINSYHSQVCTDNRFEERNNLLFVGSYKHSPNKDAIDWFIENVFPKLISSHPELVLNIVGDDPDNSLSRISNSNNVHVHGHISDAKLSKLYSKSRVIVIPLQYGAGLKGKTMESMLYNVPFIGTKYSIEGFPEKEKFFTSYDTPKDFTDKVLELLSDKNTWTNERAPYKSYLKKYFSDETIDEALLGSLHKN